MVNDVAQAAIRSYLECIRALPDVVAVRFSVRSDRESYQHVSFRTIVSDMLTKQETWDDHQIKLALDCREQVQRDYGSKVGISHDGPPLIPQQNPLAHRAEPGWVTVKQAEIFEFLA